MNCLADRPLCSVFSRRHKQARVGHKTVHCTEPALISSGGGNFVSLVKLLRKLLYETRLRKLNTAIGGIQYTNAKKILKNQHTAKRGFSNSFDNYIKNTYFKLKVWRMLKLYMMLLNSMVVHRQPQRPHTLEMHICF